VQGGAGRRPVRRAGAEQPAAAAAPEAVRRAQSDPVKWALGPLAAHRRRHPAADVPLAEANRPVVEAALRELGLL